MIESLKFGIIISYKWLLRMCKENGILFVGSRELNTSYAIPEVIKSHVDYFEGRE